MAFVATGVLYAQSPYGWRGAHRDGIYEETGLLKVWPADGPELLWSALDAGKGHTSPVIGKHSINSPFHSKNVILLL